MNSKQPKRRVRDSVTNKFPVGNFSRPRLAIFLLQKYRSALRISFISNCQNLARAKAGQICQNGAFWLKSELFLTKIRTANFDCRASRGRNKNFSARAGKVERLQKKIYDTQQRHENLSNKSLGFR